MYVPVAKPGKSMRNPISTLALVSILLSISSVGCEDTGVTPPVLPSVVSFTASPTRILEGQSVQFTLLAAADNGLALGSHGLLGKQSVFEHSMRVPLIFVGPGIPQGKSTRAFTYLLDIFPTLCDAIGIPRPADLEGESLRPLWEGTRERVRDSVFLPFIQIQRAVRDERWKLVVYPKISHLQLFDLQADPHERTNLIDRAESASHAQRLRTLMAQWQAKVGDTLEIPAENKEPETVNLTGRQRVPDQWQPEWIVDKYFGGVKAPVR